MHPVAVADGLSEIVFGGMLMQNIPGPKGVIPLVAPMAEPIPVVAAGNRWSHSDWLWGDVYATGPTADACAENSAASVSLS